MQEIRDELLKNKLESIYNADQTGLFYQLLPKRTCLSSTESRKTAGGTKNVKAKDGLFSYVCISRWSAKLPMSVIGNSSKPNCFGAKDPPVTYFSQSNAKSGFHSFGKWWEVVFLPFTRCLITSGFSRSLMGALRTQILWISQGR